MNLLSILSCCLLLFCALQGDLPVIYSWEIGFKATAQTCVIHLDPSFIIWSDSWTEFFRCNGCSFGNAMIIAESLQDSEKNYLLRFEHNHVLQFRSLGWWIYPASLVLPIDPQDPDCDSTNPEQADSILWLPPPGWQNLWRFIEIKFY
jgi:hypothetical protein